MIRSTMNDEKIMSSTTLSSAPEISVCIANFNGVTMLSECLESVFSQTGDVTFEVIVHDDASTDESVALIRDHYPRVKLITSHENVGFCISNNRMVAHATGEFVLLLNNDAALHADATRTLVETARAHGQPAIITLPQYDWDSNSLVDRGCFLDPFYNPVPNLDQTQQSVAMAIGACMFVSRSTWETLGGFPKWMGSIAEDMYLCCLARLRGMAVLVTKDSGYKHRQGASFGGNRIADNRLNTTYTRRKLSETNKIAVMIISTPGSVVWVLVPLHICALIVEGAMLALVKRDMSAWTRIYWATLRTAFTAFRRNLAQRQKEQKKRKVSLSVYYSTFTWRPRKLDILSKYGLPTLR